MSAAGLLAWLGLHVCSWVSLCKACGLSPQPPRRVTTPLPHATPPLPSPGPAVGPPRSRAVTGGSGAAWIFGRVAELSADRKTVTVTAIVVSVGAAPLSLDKVSLVLFRPSMYAKIPMLDFDTARLKCSLPSKYGTWHTVTAEPKPLAPRQSLEVTFENVTVPTFGRVVPPVGHRTRLGLLVVDSHCKSSPPVVPYYEPIFVIPLFGGGSGTP
jgi:hypothetical protein